MTQRAFTMRLQPDRLPEYRSCYQNMWPELVDAAAQAGIHSLSVFHHGDNVFVFSQTADEDAWNRLLETEVHRRWDDQLRPLLQALDDGRIDRVELVEVCHIIPNGQSGVTNSMPEEAPSVPMEPPAMQPPAEAPPPEAAPPRHETSRRGVKKKASKRAAQGKSKAKTAKKVKHLAPKSRPKGATSKGKKGGRKKPKAKKTAKKKAKTAARKIGRKGRKK